MLDHTEGEGYSDFKYPILNSTEASSPLQNSDDGFFKPKYVTNDGNFYMHKVKIFDTLGSISLKYDISKDLIRQANDFTGEEVFMFKELKIPNSSKSNNISRSSDRSNRERSSKGRRGKKEMRGSSPFRNFERNI